MAIKWSDEQLQAITTTGRSLLVSAAAGSGKTAVLAERCAYLVCDAPEPCSVDELLVVTFTHAAAAAMRARIESTLRQRLETHDDPRLAKQLALIDRAQISTLHGFCSRLLRQHFHLLGIDPNFTTLDEEEAVLLRNEVARDLFADHYAAADAGDFEQFINNYGNGNDEPLISRIIQTHELLGSMIDPQGWMNRALARIAAAKDDLRNSEPGKELSKLIATGLADLRRQAVDATERLFAIEGLEAYGEYVNELLATIVDWQDQFGGGDYDAVSAAVGAFSQPRLPNLQADAAIKARGQDIIDSVRKQMRQGALIDLCRFSSDEWGDGLNRIGIPSKVFLDLVLEFSQRYRAAKDELRAIDFSDLERFALQILRDDSDAGTLSPSGAARAYHRQFQHVLVDEYQDINAVQDAILTLLSRECVAGEPDSRQNLFCVGDVKQSIYRFRLAEPDRFIQRYDRFKQAGPEVPAPSPCTQGEGRGEGSSIPNPKTKIQNALGHVIDLQANFRTRGPLIDVVNGVFERLMTVAAAEIAYDESHRLRMGMLYPPADGQTSFTGAPVELHLLPRESGHGSEEDSENDEESDLDRTDREAILIAHRIRQLMGQEGSPKAQVFEQSKSGELRSRPIQYRDFAILLRSMKLKSDQFAEQLRLAGIPVHSDSGTGFFESMEVRDVLSLLQLLDNQWQDIPMAAVLRSPLARLPNPDDCLAKIHLASLDAAPPREFHEAVVWYAENQDDELAASLREFLRELKKWREMAHRRPLAEVLWTIYDTTGYLAFCEGLEDGRQRVANLIALHERALQFGTFQRQGLGRFMQMLQDLQKASDLGQPSFVSEADDVVRIMSVHRSKGLEFPVVILADLGKKHNLRDSRGAILVDREAYLGLQAVDEEKRIRYPSLPWVLAQDRLKRQMLAEELRVLYVAMTRAREHLILVGTCNVDAPDVWRERWADHQGPLPPDFVLRGATMLDWIGPAAIAIESDKPGSFQITQHEDREIQEWAIHAARRPKLSAEQERFAQLVPLDSRPPPNEIAERVKERLTYAYPFESFTQLPAAASVTSLTKVGRAAPGGESASTSGVVPFDRELPLPKCLEPNRRADPTEIGSVTHLVLQHLDFSQTASGAQIQRQIDEMVKRKLLAAEHRELVDLDAIAWLAGTDLGKLLQQKKNQIWRELPLYFPADTSAPQILKDPLDRIMVRGRLDLIVQTEESLTLADYKTDRVTARTIDARVEFYRPQMQSYADAITRITGQPVTRIYLAFLAPRALRILSDPTAK